MVEMVGWRRTNDCESAGSPRFTTGGEGCGRGKKKVKNIVTLPLSPISPFDKISFGILYEIVIYCNGYIWHSCFLFLFLL